MIKAISNRAFECVKSKQPHNNYDCKFEPSNSTLKVTDLGSRVVVRENKACIAAGVYVYDETPTSPVETDNGLFFKDPSKYDARIIVENGAEFIVSKNKAWCMKEITENAAITGIVGGMLFAGTRATVRGHGSKLIVSENLAQSEIGGVLLLMPLASMDIYDSGTFQVVGNIAGQAGGIGLFDGASFRLNGAGSKLICTHNRAQTYVGGCMSLDATGQMLISEGAHADISHNFAATGGAGIFLSRGVFSALKKEDDTDMATAQLVFRNNSLSKKATSYSEGGAAIAISPGSRVRLEVPSLFTSNNAHNAKGGSISMYTTSSSYGGYGECVNVILETRFSKPQWHCSPTNRKCCKFEV